MIAVMTVDLEYEWETSEYSDVIRIVPRLLDFFDENSIKATFFILGSLAEKNEAIVREIAKKHEVASHSYDHVDFSSLSEHETEMQISKSRQVFKKMGIDVKGFRAPYFRKNPYVDKILADNCFTYDSSEYGNISYTKDCITELAVPSFFPFVRAGLSYYRLLHPASKLFGSPYMFYLHPHELLESVSGKEMPFVLRQLSKRNTGAKAWKIFNGFINKKEIKWVSCSDYLKYKGFC